MIGTIEAVGIILALIVVWSVYKANRTLGNNFNVLDLLMSRGKIDRMATVFMGSWSALTFVFVGIYFTGKMTEGLFTSYAAACFAPLVIKMFAPVSDSTTTTITKLSGSESVVETNK